MQTNTDVTCHELVIDSKARFESWVKEYLRKLIPHGMSIFGLARRHAFGYAVHESVFIDVPHSLLNQVCGPCGSFHCLFLNKWYREQTPQVFNVEIENINSQSSATCILSLSSLGMRRVLVHGHFGENDPVATFFTLYQTGDMPSVDQSILSAAAPIIHSALINSLGHELIEEVHAEAIRATSRELDVMRLLALGKTNWEVGKILGISEFTVKTHIQRLMKKTDTSSRTQLVAQFMKLDSRSQ